MLHVTFMDLNQIHERIIQLFSLLKKKEKKGGHMADNVLRRLFDWFMQMCSTP